MFQRNHKVRRKLQWLTILGRGNVSIRQYVGNTFNISIEIALYFLLNTFLNFS